MTFSNQKSKNQIRAQTYEAMKNDKTEPIIKASLLIKRIDKVIKEYTSANKDDTRKKFENAYKKLKDIVSKYPAYFDSNYAISEEDIQRAKTLDLYASYATMISNERSKKDKNVESSTTTDIATKANIFTLSVEQVATATKTLNKFMKFLSQEKISIVDLEQEIYRFTDQMLRIANISSTKEFQKITTFSKGLDDIIEMLGGNKTVLKQPVADDYKNFLTRQVSILKILINQASKLNDIVEQRDIKSNRPSV